MNRSLVIVIVVALVAFLLFQLRPAHAQFAECGFGFEIDTQSSAFQSMLVDGEEKVGFWLSINRAPKDVREVARFIGRLQVCLTTPDGKPRTLTRGGQSFTLESPFVSNCTATLLPQNRLLTNAHCFYDPDLTQAGFTVVREARVNFNYTSRDDTGAVRTYLVDNRELALDEERDAMVLKILVGDANADLGGHVPMKMMTQVEPFQELRMIHHPNADPQQYSAGTCQVHRRQEEIPPDRSPFRHTCESMGGSSGSLIFDARTFAVVALHNQGGLRPTGDSFNGGHKIGPIEASLNLGFELYEEETGAEADSAAQAALVAALIQNDTALKIAALEAVIRDYPGTDAASKAATALASIQPQPETRDDERTRALDAQQALLEALVLTNTESKITALEKVVREYPGTDAADQAVTVLASVLPKPSDRGADNAEVAQDALLAALVLTDDERKVAALKRVISTYPGTPAATQAETVLATLIAKPDVDPPPPPPASLQERMLANPHVQECDRLGGTPNHPDKLSGAMVAQGTPFSAIDGPRAEAACRRALQDFPDHPRLMAFLADVLFAQDKYAEGAGLFQRAAELGDPMAQASLGFINYAGRGVPQNFALAREWMEKAVAQGYPGGHTALGLYYYEGRAVQRDYTRAFEHFDRAAAMGDATGFSLLGRMYEHGHAAPVDPDRAADLYIRALQGGVEWIITSKNVWTQATGRALQQRLQQLGYYSGALDGAVGAGTKAAMSALRAASL